MIDDLKNVAPVNGHELAAFDHGRAVLKAGVELDQDIDREIQTFDFGGDIADDDASGEGVPVVVLADDGVVVAAYDVAGGFAGDGIPDVDNCISYDFLIHGFAPALTCFPVTDWIVEFIEDHGNRLGEDIQVTRGYGSL